MHEPVIHLLVVDDDDRLRALLTRYLHEQGFAVSAAAGAEEALQLMAMFVFDLMILDVMMPGKSGLELAGMIRAEHRHLPLLMLSARAEARDRIAGLSAGVDDYLTKPFEPEELVLRIQAILRRVAEQSPSVVRFGAYRFNLQTRQLEKGNDPVALTTAEAELLNVLAGQAGKAVSREMLAAALGLAEGSERGVDVQVTRLRRKIEPEEGRAPHVQTVRGAGYMLVTS